MPSDSDVKDHKVWGPILNFVLKWPSQYLPTNGSKNWTNWTYRMLLFSTVHCENVPGMPLPVSHNCATAPLLRDVIVGIPQVKYF